MVKQDSSGNQTIVDDHIFGEVLTLGEQQTIKREIVYAAPTYLNGNFQFLVLANDQKREIIALSNIGEVVLMGDNQYVEIVQDTCYLQIKDDERDSYTIDQGVSIGEDETLIASCEVVNHFDRDVMVIPQFETFLRTRFGKRVDDENVEQGSFNLAAQEKRKISFDIPKSRVPQAYDSVLFLEDEKQEVMSNAVAFHYVVSGLSATIQNLRLDKDSYKKNDEAKMEFCWSRPADNYYGSRLGYTDGDGLLLEVALQNSNAQDCAEKHLQPLDDEVCVSGIVLPIIRDCDAPMVSVHIKDVNGNILDNQNFDFKDESEQESAITEERDTQQKSFLLYGYGIVAFLFVVSLGVIFVKRKSLNVWLLFFAAGSIVSFNIPIAQADFSHYAYQVAAQFGSYWPHEVKVVYSLNKLSYAPGEQITGNVRVDGYTCANSMLDYSLRINLGTGSGSVKNTGSYSYSASAPSTPGTYTAYFTFKDERCSSAFYSSCMADVSSRKGSSMPMLRSGLYVTNKASNINWTVPATQAAFDVAGLTPYNHYVLFGTKEGISPCALRCDSSGSAGGTYAIRYTVTAPTTIPRNCTTPWGSTVSDGSFVVAYFAQSVPFGSTCTSERRYCADGVLSGSAQYPTCAASLPPTTYGCANMKPNTSKCFGTIESGFSMTKEWTVVETCAPSGMAECQVYNDGSCGTNAGIYEASQDVYFPSYTFCLHGKPVDAVTGFEIPDPDQSILFPDEGKSVKWKCKNYDTISNDCVAQRKKGAATAVNIDNADHGAYKEERP